MPLLALLISLGVVVLAIAVSDMERTSQIQWSGQLVMYSILPSYFILAQTYLRRVSAHELGNSGLEFPDLPAQLKNALNPSGKVIAAWIAGGVIWGLAQFTDGFTQMGTTDIPWILVVATTGNVCVWATAAWMFAYRLQHGVHISRIGRSATVDVYHLERCKPFARLAVYDVLVIMGALTLMPLQALDAQFRLDNYLPGFIVAIPSALALFMLPLTGIRASIRQAKQKQVALIDEQLSASPIHELAQRESLLAHRERFSNTSDWPIDFRIVSRVLFYLFIPPLAWIGAALVENLVDQFIN